MSEILSDININAITLADRPWVCDFLKSQWGSSIIVTLGQVYQIDNLPGFIAGIVGKKAGIITFHISGTGCEIISLNSLVENRGVGTALIRNVQDYAKARNCKTLTVITTNDNVPAQDFYKRKGFRINRVNKDILNDYRKMKPEIPEYGINGIPIRDEIVFSMNL